MKTLLLEIGTEEIPAGYIDPALKALSENLLKKLDDARISHGGASVFGTPRRLAVMVADVAEKQETVTITLTGPPEKAALGADGKYTVAALKFAEKAGISADNLRIAETPKGKYLCADKTEEGIGTIEVLQEKLPEIILGTPFPKTMKWGSSHIHFARPIQRIAALFGKDVICFKLGDIVSGRDSAGHRFMSPDTVTLYSPEDYIPKLRSACVIADSSERRKNIEAEIAAVASAQGGKILPDAELVDIVNNLVEYPVPVAGKFDTAFLEVPDEVLINSMREHQKYFAVVDAKNRLMPCFIAVNNTRAKDMNLVAKGHERVLRARLSDARFFYRADLESPMDNWVDKLKRVLFQAKLGSMYEKILRVRQLAEYIAESVNHDPNLKKHVSRAAYLCKADLVSQVVGEFPKLQGVMGRIYAKAAGEPEPVYLAIEEHYRPTYSGGALPETMTGAIVAIADKLDSICGCFSVNLIPTGASDPYALRRQAIGIIQIMLQQNFSFSLMAAIEKSLSLFTKLNVTQIRKISAEVYTFLQNRMTHILTEEGFSKDVVAAVADVTVDHVPNVWHRVRALENLKAKPDFEPIAAAFRRVVNIIRKDAGNEELETSVSENLFEHESEKALYSAYKSLKETVLTNLDKGEFDESLSAIALLRPAVDAFFESVMVMTDNAKVRNNRLALLKKIANLFGMFADFSKIST